MRKTIYVPSQEVWNEVTAEAKKKGVSISAFLLSGVKKDSQLDRIEGLLKKLKEFIGPPEKEQGEAQVETLLKKQSAAMQRIKEIEQATAYVYDEPEYIPTDSTGDPGIFNPQPKARKKK